IGGHPHTRTGPDFPVLSLVSYRSDMPTPDPVKPVLRFLTTRPAAYRADWCQRLQPCEASARSGMIKRRRTHVPATPMMLDEEDTDGAVTQDAAPTCRRDRAVDSLGMAD